MIGQTISHYKILEKLGGGGMGVVYKAEDTTLKRIVALKLLPPYLTVDPEAKERFIHEAQSASALDHPNICTVFEVGGHDDGLMFIAMAYYEGETLKDRIKRGPVGVEEALTLAVQIAAGLSEAHEHGIIHRDIKPANVLLTKNGVAKIVDFGLAKVSGATTLTKSGSTLGTIAYMAPEQLQGAQVDARADVFSLGVILYELLSGQLPFRGEHEAALMYSIVNEDPKPVMELVPTIPVGVSDVVSRALEKNPQKRYQSAAEMLEVVEKLRGDRSESKRLPAPKRILAFKRMKLWAAIGIVALLVGAGTIGVLLYRGTQPRPGYEVQTGLTVAVLDFGTREGVSKTEAAAIADAFEMELVSLKAFTVVDRSRIREILDQKGFQMSEACTQIECLVEIGKILRVDRLFAGAIGKSGTLFTVNVQLIDIGAAEIVSNTTRQHLGDIEELNTRIIPDLARKMALDVTRKKSIAIMDFDSRGGLTKEERLSLSEAFRAEMMSNNAITVVGRQRMSEILTELGFQVSEPSSCEQCVVEAGKILRVEYVFTGTIGKVGTLFIVNIYTIDIKAGEVKSSRMRQHRGDIETLLSEVIPEMVRQEIAELTKSN